MAKKRFIGCQYPLLKTPRGIFAQRNEVDQIKADMLQLLLTNPGERVMLPEFGTPLRKLVFEPNDPALEIEAKKMIADSITKWEPRVEVQAIEVSSRIDPDDLDDEDTQEETGHILNIKILFFDPVNIQQVEELKLQVPLSGA